jgi:hypothetical protein
MAADMSRMGNARMKVAFKSVVRLTCLSLAIAGVGLAAPLAAKDASEPATAAPPSAVGGSVDSLRRHIAANELTELRTTYNGNYGASLLFYADKISYYVVMFHNKDFWRVIKTDVAADAERLYRTFSEQTRMLAQVDIETAQLEANTEYTKHLLALNAARLQSLRDDLERQRQQAQQVAQAQQAAQQQAASLKGDLRSTNEQLESMQRQIRLLEQMQADPALQLPEVRAQPDSTPEVEPGD